MKRREFAVRDATVGDGAFIELMLLAAVNWLPDRQTTLDQLRSDPDLIHYVAGWPQESDIGLIAEDLHGVPIGAVWLRYFSDEDHWIWLCRR